MDKFNDLPDGSEQLSDMEIVACLIAKMIDDGDDACVTGHRREVFTLGEAALVMCDMARAAARGEEFTPASLHILCCFKSDLALHRAALQLGQP